LDFGAHAKRCQRWNHPEDGNWLKVAYQCAWMNSVTWVALRSFVNHPAQGKISTKDAIKIWPDYIGEKVEHLDLGFRYEVGRGEPCGRSLGLGVPPVGWWDLCMNLPRSETVRESSPQW
ncbi:unnamed protein product, partial [Allacma fusca]